MKNLTVGEFIKNLNEIVSHWNGVKMNDNGEFHKDVYEKVNTYLTSLGSDLEYKTWRIVYSPEPVDGNYDFSMLGSGDELFDSIYNFTKDKRTTNGSKGLLNSFTFIPKFTFNSVEDVKELTMEEYIVYARLKVKFRKIEEHNNMIKEMEEALKKSKDIHHEMIVEFENLSKNISLPALICI